MAYIADILLEEEKRFLQAKTAYEADLVRYPKGTIIWKKISGRAYPYLVYRVDGKVKTDYISEAELPEIEEQVRLRRQAKEALKNINANLKIVQRALGHKREKKGGDNNANPNLGRQGRSYSNG